MLDGIDDNSPAAAAPRGPPPPKPFAAAAGAGIVSTAAKASSGGKTTGIRVYNTNPGVFGSAPLGAAAPLAPLPPTIAKIPAKSSGFAASPPSMNFNNMGTMAAPATVAPGAAVVGNNASMSLTTAKAAPPPALRPLDHSAFNAKSRFTTNPNAAVAAGKVGTTAGPAAGGALVIPTTFPTGAASSPNLSLNASNANTNINSSYNLAAQQQPQAQANANYRNKFQILRLHSTVDKQEQRRVFDVPDNSNPSVENPPTRKIVVATNIAETSITIPDIVHVIDGGFHRSKCYCATTNSSGLDTVLVSKSNVRQRRGRAGRCRPGNFFALYSKKQWEKMVMQEKPEMLRTPVEELVLQVKSLKIFDLDNSSSTSAGTSGTAPGAAEQASAASSTTVPSSAKKILEKAIAPPTEQSIQNALHLLQALGAIVPVVRVEEVVRSQSKGRYDATNNPSSRGASAWQAAFRQTVKVKKVVGERLTELGRKLNNIPLHPTLARMLLLADVMSKCCGVGTSGGGSRGGGSFLQGGNGKGQMSSFTAASLFEKIATISLAVSNKSPFCRVPAHLDMAALDFREKQSGYSYSDHFMLANVYEDCGNIAPLAELLGRDEGGGDRRGGGSRWNNNYGGPGRNKGGASYESRVAARRDKNSLLQNATSQAREFLDFATLEQNGKSLEEMHLRIADRKLKVLTFPAIENFQLQNAGSTSRWGNEFHRGGGGVPAGNMLGMGGNNNMNMISATSSTSNPLSLLRAVLAAGLPVAAADADRFAKCLIDRVM